MSKTLRGESKDFLRCLSNSGYAASLVPNKIYARLPDDEATARGLVRVIDETGEDYLFPARLFTTIDVETAQARSEP